ncbi:MAG TPA: hypothetical protein PKE45_11300 [Caldilineaceae bacterium]|nr:hypothetical protein [Caldilineaceae bacterium]
MAVYFRLMRDVIVNQTIELSVRHSDLLRQNSSIFGTTPGAMISRLLDDEFGGLPVGQHSGLSPHAVQQQIESLESLLRSQPR